MHFLREFTVCVLVTLFTVGTPGLVRAQCVPKCRTNFLCIDGECVSRCNPVCPAGHRCTAEGECEAQPTGPSDAETVVTSMEMMKLRSSINEYRAMAGWYDSFGWAFLVAGLLNVGVGIAFLTEEIGSDVAIGLLSSGGVSLLLGVPLCFVLANNFDESADAMEEDLKALKAQTLRGGVLIGPDRAGVSLTWSF